MKTYSEVARKRQKDRDLELLRLRESGVTLQAIGDSFGMTRERVRQITKRLSNGKKFPYVAKPKKRIECLQCGKVTEKVLSSKSSFCNKECFSKWNAPTKEILKARKEKRRKYAYNWYYKNKKHPNFMKYKQMRNKGLKVKFKDICK